MKYMKKAVSELGQVNKANKIDEEVPLSA